MTRIIGLAFLGFIFAAQPAMAADATKTTTASKPAAAADPLVDDAVAFTRSLTAKATTALTSKKSKAEQLKDFQAVLNEALALDVIGKFMIGGARKSMTPAQIARYDKAFPPYLTRLYADQFADIVGRPLEVIEAKKLGTKDVVVRTRFNRKEGAPINVDWRVRKLKTGEQKAIDIIVGGVSIMSVKREEFSAFVAQNGVDALIARIEKEGAAS